MHTAVVPHYVAPLPALPQNGLHRTGDFRQPHNQRGATMKSTGQERQIQKFQAEETNIVPAIVTCLGGTLGVVLIAAGPWLALGWYL